MHKIAKLFSTMLIATLLISVAGCHHQNGMVKREKSEVQLYAEKDPMLRAWGQHQVESAKYERLAQQESAHQARTTAAGNLQSWITAELEDFMEQYNYSENEDIASKTTEKVKQVVDEIMNSWYVSKTDSYTLPDDGSIRYYSCVEYKGDIKKLIEQTAKNLKQAISDDRKMKIDFDELKFEEKMKSDLEEYKKRRMEELQNTTN